MLGKWVGISLLVLSLAYLYGTGPGRPGPKEGKVLETPSGKIGGLIAYSRDGREFYSWYSIPYAKPPVGNLRFEDPEPAGKWKGVHNGTVKPTACAQGNLWGLNGSTEVLAGEEDCLFLNVFVPKEVHDQIVDGKSRAKVPVIFYIHGGGYVMGSSDMLDPAYLMDEDVLVVAINYRLDVLGFLSTGDGLVRGNMGLKDQLMALKWVQKNIAAFGGDPQQVTIFGTSAGAGSVHNHMLSPLSKGLFQKVFAQSGAVGSSWGLNTREESLGKAQKLAGILKCPQNDHKKLVACLKKKPVVELIAPRAAALQGFFAMKPDKGEEGFVPVVETVQDEKAFMRENPFKIIVEGRAHRVPLLIGYTTHEGLLASGTFIVEPESLIPFEAALPAGVRQFFGVKTPHADEISQKIYELYFPVGKEFTAKEKNEGYTTMMGDALFHLDTWETVYHQRKFSPVYYYIHNKTDVKDPMEIFMYIRNKWPILAEVAWYYIRSFVRTKILRYPPIEHGIGHATDLFYYYPSVMDYISPGTERYEYSKDLVKMLAQFAEPESKLEFRGVTIPPTPQSGPIHVAKFQNDRVEIQPECELFQSRMEFLRSLNIRDIPK